MKSNLFRQATALAISSFVIFSGQALGISSNHQKFTDANTLSKSEIVIIAQGASKQASKDTVQACAQVEFAVEVLGKTITGVEQVEKQVEIQQLKEIPPDLRQPIVDSLKQSIKTFAEAQVIAEQDENSTLVITLTKVISVLDNVAEAIAQGQVGNLEVLNGAKADAEQGCQFQ